MHVPRIVRALACKHLVAAREEPHLDRTLRLRRLQRMHQSVHAIVAGQRGEAEIGDDEPLRGQRVELIHDRARRLRNHDVDAGGERAYGLSHGKCRGHIGVERLLDAHLAFPHLRAAPRRQLIDVVAVERALKIVTEHGVEEIAVADAVDFERDTRGVDADHRDSALAGARQDIGLARESHERLAVTNIHIELGRARQGLLHGRRNAGAQRNGVALAVLEPLHAELACLRRYRRLVLAGDCDERREIRALDGEVLGELKADPGGRRIGIDAVVEQPKPMILADALIFLPDLRDLAQVEGHAQCVKRRTPDRTIHVGAREHHQALGLLTRIA